MRQRSEMRNETMLEFHSGLLVYSLLCWFMCNFWVKCVNLDKGIDYKYFVGIKFISINWMFLSYSNANSNSIRGSKIVDNFHGYKKQFVYAQQNGKTALIIFEFSLSFCFSSLAYVKKQRVDDDWDILLSCTVLITQKPINGVQNSILRRLVIWSKKTPNALFSVSVFVYVHVRTF